jgi:hypothetical protein
MDVPEKGPRSLASILCLQIVRHENGMLLLHECVRTMDVIAGGPTTVVFGIGKRNELLSLWLERTIDQAFNAVLALPP